MESDKETTILIQIAGQIGALAEKVDNTAGAVQSLDAKYERGKEAAQKHAALMEIKLDHKVDREEIKPLIPFINIVRNWQIVLLIIIGLVVLGFFKFGERFEKVVETKQQLEKLVPKGGMGK